MPELVQETYSIKTSAPFGDGGMARKANVVSVLHLNPKCPELHIPARRLGYRSIKTLTVQALKEHYSVVWNGDLENPGFSFDGYPDGPFQFHVEVMGS